MLIGVSGKIGSGKDLVGEIIQFLTTYIGKEGIRSFESSRGKTDKDGYGYAGFGTYNSKFAIRKFADKLKDIVCILIGCTREQLEDRIFKETELGEEWWYYQTYDVINNKIVGIYSTLKEANKECGKHHFSCDSKRIKPTPRMLLQEIGTNLFRDRLHPDCWINATLSEYKLAEDYQVGTTPENLKWVEGEYPDWVITDLRFLNEAKAIKSKDGITIRVNRPKYPHGIYKIGEGCFTGAKGMEEFDKALKKEIGIVEHYSETALDDYEFDYTIENNGTIEELIEKVKEILIREKIL